MEERHPNAECDFFISYTNTDQAWAEWIAWQLKEAGYSIVLQAWDFRPGNDFVLEIQQASATARRIIAVLSPAYFASQWGGAEWRVALGNDPTGEQRHPIPVRVHDCQPPGLLATRVYIDLAGKDAIDAKNALLQGIQERGARPTQGPQFPGVSSHAMGKTPQFPGVPLQASRPRESLTVRKLGDLSQHAEIKSDTGVSVAFSPDSQLLAMSGYDIIEVRRIRDLGDYARLYSKYELGHLVAFPDNDIVARAGSRSADLWKLGTNSQGKFESRYGETLIETGWGFDGGASSTWYGGKPLGETRCDQLALSPNGRLVAALVDGETRVWRIGSDTPDARLTWGSHSPMAFVFSPNSALLTTCFGNTVRLWGMPAGTWLARAQHEAEIGLMVFNSDSTLLATGDAYGSKKGGPIVRLWEVSSGRELARLDHEGPVRRAIFSPDGTFLAMAAARTAVRLWEIW